MTAAVFPLDPTVLQELARTHGTPLFVYDADVIRRRCAEVRPRFDVVRYAQKANANLALLELLRQEGCRVDAVSAGEIERALAAGFRPEEIVFTSDLFDRAALACVARHRVAVNLGSADMLEQYRGLDVGRAVTLRVNPGFGAGHGQRVTTGGDRSKHGVWHEDLPRTVAQARTLGLEVSGLHVHVGSGARLEGLLSAAQAIARLAALVGPSLGTISAGGGLPVPYRPTDVRPDLDRLAGAWAAVRRDLAAAFGHPLSLEVEPGRYLVAESGVLLTEVRAVKRSGSSSFVLVDAGFHNLPRPLLYGAYHEMRALGFSDVAELVPQIVAGPLCESSDVFTQDERGELDPRPLPRLVPGDLLAIYDVGAYAASMASNYNSQPFAAEVLVDGSSVRSIGRRQRLEELWQRELSPEKEATRVSPGSPHQPVG